MSNHRAVEIAEKLNRAGVVTKWTGVRTASRNLASVILLVALVVGGIIALLVFWSQLLKPGDLSSVSLPLVALAAGVAATFNPCSLPALPGFLATGASDDGTLRMRDRSGLSLSASLGAMTVIIVFGIIVAFAGKESKELISPYFRWVQLGVGLSLVGLAVLHITGQTNRIPLVGAIMGVGSRMWQGSMGKPTARNGYLFGAGFVAVGAG